MNIEYGSVKHKVLVVTLLAGEYPYKSLDLLNDTDWKKRDGINQLKKDGLIYVKKIGNEKRIRLKLHKKRKGKYGELFEGAEVYEPDISYGERKLERKDRIAETFMMMIEAGINVTPDSKPAPDHNGPLKEADSCLPYYITSLEARAAIKIKEDKGKGARFHGTLVSQGGIYNIYNMGNAMMEWVRPAEKTAVDFNVLYSKKMTPWGSDTKEWLNCSAIILSRRMEYIVDFVKGNVTPRHGQGSSKNLMNINEYYKHTFYLPLSRQGQIMLDIMAKKNWHYYLVGMFYKEIYLAPDNIKLSIACDAIKDGCYGLVFLDGDIGRLKKFTNIKLREEDAGRYKVICYDFQEEYVKKLAPQGMIVTAVEFDKVINAFYQIYEQFEGVG